MNDSAIHEPASSRRPWAPRPAVIALSTVTALAAFLGAGASYPGSRATPPKNSAKPTIAGELREGATLTVSPGTWRGAKPVRFTYQWVSCTKRVSNCVSIRGATGRRYKLRSRDVGRRLIVSVTAANRDGGSSAESNATAAVKVCET